jgi:hypothetical protein
VLFAQAVEAAVNSRPQGAHRRQEAVLGPWMLLLYLLLGPLNAAATGESAAGLMCTRAVVLCARA